MKLRASLLALLLLILGAGHCLAQENEQSLVDMELRHSRAAYTAGNSYAMELLIKIQPGYHINSTRPESPELVPTRLTLTGVNGIRLADYTVPPVTYHTVAGEESPWAVWSGDVVFTPVIEIAKTVKPGSYPLTFELFYQACDDQICQMPSTRELGFIIEVVAPQN